MDLVNGLLRRGDIQNGHNLSSHKQERPQTKTDTKRYQNGHIHLGNEKSFGHQIFIITAEMSTNRN